MLSLLYVERLVRGISSVILPNCMCVCVCVRVRVHACVHTKVLIQKMDFCSTSQENYSIRLLSVRKFERQNLFFNTLWTGEADLRF